MPADNTELLTSTQQNKRHFMFDYVTQLGAELRVNLQTVSVVFLYIHFLETLHQ